MTAAAGFTAALLVLAATVAALVAGIAGRRASRRRREARRRRLTAPLRPLLLELVAGEPDEQAHAAARLAALSPRLWRSVEPDVVTLLGKVRGEAREEVVRLLTGRGVLAEGLRGTGSRSAVTRARSAELLGVAGWTEALPTLLHLLAHDPHAEVRLVAARSLGRIGAADAAEPLLAALGAQPPRVPAQVAAQALLRIGAPGTIALSAALDSPAAVVRATAVQILGMVGAVGSVAGLCRRLREDDEPDVRSRAATALGLLGMPSALPDLLTATAPAPAGAEAPSRGLRAAAAGALGELGDPRGVPGLQALLGDEDAHVAAAAGPALVQLGTAGQEALRVVAQTPPDADGSPDPGAAARATRRAAEALAVARLRGLVAAEPATAGRAA